MLNFNLPPLFYDLSLLFVRLLLAAAFFHEARIKFKDIQGFAEGHDLSIGLSYVVATVELLAAIGMFFGLLAQLAGVGIVLLMLITTSLQIFKWHNDYWAAKSGWEYDLILLTLGLIIVVFGAGGFAIDFLLTSPT